MSADIEQTLGFALPGGMQIPSWLHNILTSKLLIFNCLFSWAWILYAKKCIQPLKQRTDEHKKRDQKYAAFCRKDYERLNKSWGFYLWMPTNFLRMILPYTSIAIMCMFS